MNSENREQEYKNTAMHLIQSLYMSGSNVIATIGFFIALSKKGRLFDYTDISKFDYIYDETIHIDKDTIVRLYDVCGMVLMRDTILEIIRIMDHRQNIDHAKLFEEVIAIYSSQEGHKRGTFFQPKELTHLVSSILKENDIKRVYNPFAGIGSYQLDNNDVSYNSQEINRETWMIGKLRMYINDIYSEYTWEDSILNWVGETRKFDAVVATPPFKLLLSKEQDSLLYREDLEFRHKTVETLFFSRSITSINEDGIIIGIVSSNFLYDSSSTARSFRQNIIDKGLVREVIQLPANMFNTTAISTAIVVLSKRSQNQVRVIDASKCYTQQGKMNILDWKRIMDIRKSGSNIDVRLVNNTDISEQDCSLVPARYLEIEEAILEGYNAISLKDIVSINNGIKCDDRKGHFVNIGDLSSEGLYSKVEIDILPFGEIKPNFRCITLPVLLVSKVRFLKPTYIEASETNPIYISPNIMALNVDVNKIYIPYLAYELSLKSDRLQKGAVIPNFQSKDILNLKIAIPSLSSQEEVLSQQKAIIESLIFADKNAKIKEHGLEEIIRRQKNDFIEEIRIKKHSLAQYLAEINSSVSALSKFIENRGIGEELISQRRNISLSDHVSTLFLSIEEMNKKLDILTKESVFGESKVIDVNTLLKKFKSTSHYSIEYVLDKDSIPSKNVSVYMSEDDFNEIIHHIISNAVKHGFKESQVNNIIRIHLTYNQEYKMYILKISNNGKPMPKGMDSRRYGIRGEIAGVDGNEGIGGYRVKSIIEHYKGNYSIENDPENIFPVEISVQLPKYE